MAIERSFKYRVSPERRKQIRDAMHAREMSFQALAEEALGRFLGADSGPWPSADERRFMDEMLEVYRMGTDADRKAIRNVAQIIREKSQALGSVRD